MATLIKKEYEQEKATTVFTVGGKVVAEEIIQALKEFYQDGYTTNILWNLADADLAEITTAQLHQLLAVAKSFGHLRPKGKTAIVVASTLGFGMGRMYEILCDLNQHPISLRVFTTMEEAREWLAS